VSSSIDKWLLWLFFNVLFKPFIRTGEQYSLTMLRPFPTKTLGPRVRGHNEKKYGPSSSRPNELTLMIVGARGHGRAQPLAGAQPARGRHGPSQGQAQWLAEGEHACRPRGSARTVGGDASPARGGMATDEGWCGGRDGRVGVHDEEEDGKK
jgi:hypothetical protein